MKEGKRFAPGVTRFKVFAITYGGQCAPLYISPSEPRRSQVQDKRGVPVHPYSVEGLHVCPHCTGRRNWNRLSRIRRSQHQVY
jgi:hypothetical protein